MSERAKAFVESWVNEYVHPATYETENHHSESRRHAMACYESALVEGIAKDEIAEEYPDLVSYMAARHEQFIDEKIDGLLRKDH